MDPALSIGPIIATLLILASWSYLYKENPFYRWLEFTTIATITGWYSLQSLIFIQSAGINQVLHGNYIKLIPIALGLTMYTTYLGRQYRWLTRLTVAILVGTGLGLTLRTITETQITSQVVATVFPLSGAAVTLINNIVTALIVATVLLSFVFTIERKGALGFAMRVGRIGLMAGLGAFYGNTVLTRLTYIINEVTFILRDWLGILH